jgi:hypothetical protein
MSSVNGTVVACSCGTSFLLQGVASKEVHGPT